LICTSSAAREGFDLNAPTPELHLTWEPGTGKGAALPDSYFDSVRDRRKFINCTHPASGDTYVVSITLEIHEGALAGVQIEQSVNLGPY
jgi:hypothetical protein